MTKTAAIQLPKIMENFFIDPKIPYAELRYTVQSNRVFKPHLHERISIGAVAQGQVIFTCSGDNHILKPGSLALINPEIMHSCNTGANLCRSYYMLYLDVEYALKVQQSLWQTTTFQAMQSPLLVHPELYTKYIAAMDQLLDPGMDTLGKEQLLASLTGEIFLLVCLKGEETKPAADSLETFKNLLSSKLENDITLDQIARQLDANPYTLLRQFKAAYGVTPHAYRMNCRIEKSRTLLQQGMDITDTALLCGFFDQSHFHKAFKAATTVTPKEYQVNFLQ